MEATGLLPAVFVAKALGLPCIFARKQRQISISDSYQTSFKSSVSSSVQVGGKRREGRHTDCLGGRGWAGGQEDGWGVAGGGIGMGVCVWG